MPEAVHTIEGPCMKDRLDPAMPSSNRKDNAVLSKSAVDGNSFTHFMGHHPPDPLWT